MCKKRLCHTGNLFHSSVNLLKRLNFSLFHRNLCLHNFWRFPWFFHQVSLNQFVFLVIFLIIYFSVFDTMQVALCSYQLASRHTLKIPLSYQSQWLLQAMKFQPVAALVDARGHYVLNGNFIVSAFHKELHVSGTILEYSGAGTIIERINGTGMIYEDIYVHVCSATVLYG